MFDAPAASVGPTLPAPVGIGQTQGQKPRQKSQQTTILGSDASGNAPQSPGFSTGKTLLGQ